jgi:beta-mannosidase
VPGCVHLDLRALDAIPDPFYGTHELDLQWIEERDWEYRGTFSVSAALLNHSILELCADGLDTVATVSLNGHPIATTDNMFVAHRWDVKPYLRRGGNELVIRFRSALDYIRHTRTDFTPPAEFNDPVGSCVRIRKQQCQFGWDWGPRFVTAGIWRDLRLEARSANRLAHLHLVQTHAPDRRQRSVTLTLTPELATADPLVTYQATVRHGSVTVAEISGPARDLIVLIKNPELWWPAGQGDQPLYDVTLTARDDAGQDLGTLVRRIGLRTLTLERTVAPSSLKAPTGFPPTASSPRLTAPPTRAISTLRSPPT